MSQDKKSCDLVKPSKPLEEPVNTFSEEPTELPDITSDEEPEDAE